MHKVVLLHTNDIHSRLEQTPKIASFIRRSKQESDAPVLALDIGDHMDRMNPLTEGTLGACNVELMNATGYDLFVPGNNEGLSFTAERLEQLLGRQASFQTVCANMYLKGTNQRPDWLLPYHIASLADGVRIGLFGLTVDFNDFYQHLGWTIRDPIEEAARVVEQLRKEVDAIVVLSHLGIRRDQEMAEAVQGIDCIIGAHSHHLLEEPMPVGRTLLFAAGKFGTHVGRIELWFDRSAGGLIRAEGSCLTTDSFPEDADVANILEANRIASRTRLDEVAAVIREPIPHTMAEDSQLGNLLAIGVRRRTNAQLALVNNGQFLGGLDSGEVSREMILEICPSPINLCRMLLKGEHILRALEESLLPKFRDKPIRGFGFRGNVLGGLSIDGIEVTYDDDGPPYRRITEVRIGGERLRPDREYTVGTMDMFTFGIGYKSLQLGRDIEYLLPDFIRDVIADQLKNGQDVRDAARRRWKRK